jgi:hypothetical protein
MQGTRGWGVAIRKRATGAKVSPAMVPVWQARFIPSLPSLPRVHRPAMIAASCSCTRAPRERGKSERFLIFSIGDVPRNRTFFKRIN